MEIIVMDKVVQLMASVLLDHVFQEFVLCVMITLLDIIVILLVVLVTTNALQDLVLTQHVFLVITTH